MRKRTQAREFALIILYQKDVTRFEIQQVADNFWLDQKENDSEIKEFTGRLVFGVNQNLDSIDEKISSYATNWQLKRMAIIDRNILRLGLYELLYADDIPPKVTINEAVELAKKFGDVESSKFVNGILDKIHKTELVVKKKTSS
jgi:transcription antitermination factor NusB